MTDIPKPEPGDTSWDDWATDEEAMSDKVAVLDVSDFAATGTRDTTTFLRGDNTWAVPPGTGTAPTLATIPAGSVVYVDQNGDGTWPNRSTSRTDVKVIWTKTVVGSSDPAAATSPSVAGAYSKDLVVGV